MESGFVCGNRIEGNSFVIREHMRCGENVEAAYYSNDATRGGRILTTDVCAICYNTEDVISASEIKKRRNLQGKNPLPICRACLDLNVLIPRTKCSRTNSQEKVAQTQAKKRQRLRASVENKRRKGRKAAVMTDSLSYLSGRSRVSDPAFVASRISDPAFVAAYQTDGSFICTSYVHV
jgi:hypothetical protein